MGFVSPGTGQHRAARNRDDMITWLGRAFAIGVDLIVGIFALFGAQGPAWGVGLLLLGNVVALLA